MKRLAMLLLVLLSAPAWGADPVSIANYVKQLAGENGFEIVGTNVVGGDTFTPPAKIPPLEKALTRALSRYNHRVDYRDKKIVRVVILSRRGESVGALPDDNLPTTPQLPDEMPQVDPDNQ